MGNLERFVEAHENSYQNALSEIESGHKISHWMWYIFPQLKGLGRSPTSEYYGIKNLQEAVDFLNHPVLGHNLLEISEVLLSLSSNNATEIFGKPDDKKLKSCMTLFAAASSDNLVFKKVLQKFFDGKEDKRTLKMLENMTK